MFSIRTLLGIAPVRPENPLARMREVEVGQKGLLAAFEEHEKQDEKRFGDMTTRFEAGLNSVRGDLVSISSKIDKALSGDNDVPGLRERVRTLEQQSAVRASDLLWMRKLLWSTIAGLVSSVVGGLFLFFATRGGVH